MIENRQKLAKLISDLRTEKGISQAELAKQLGTSQSAITRIEQGGQNLSLDTIDRISHVLGRELVHVASSEIALRVHGGHELHGSIRVNTSKNAAVGLLCASLLNKGVTRLKRVARIEEVNRIIEVLNSLGVKTKWLPGNDLEIRPPKILNTSSINVSAAMKTRAAIMFMGSFMHEQKQFSIPFAGGCELGKRTILPHLYALEELGISVETKSKTYEVSVNKHPAKRPIVLYESGDTTTEHILIAAARFDEETIIKMASANYAIQDLCLYLKKLGVKIDGIGTTTLRVKGVKNIKRNVTYCPSEDPVEAMTFICAAVTTNSALTITHAPIDFLELELLKLEKMGLQFTTSGVYVSDNGFTKLVDIHIQKHNGKLLAPIEKVYGRPFPGLNIDHLPYFVPIAAVAKGRTLIHDWVFEDRAGMYMEMKKVGVNIQLADPHRAWVEGPTKWKAADVVCPQGLRPAVIILIGMLAAQGTSVLRNVYTINRGYEQIAERFNSIGAKIEVM